MARPRQDINICKLAEEAGVSHMTVSRVLNNRAGVSEEVRGRIKDLQKKYKFKTNYQIRRKPKVAVVILEEGLTDYYRRLLNGIMRYTQTKNMEVTVVTSDRNGSGLLQKVRDLQCSAVLVPLGGLYEKAYPILTESNLPVVLLDAKTSLPGLGYIDNDSYIGSSEATRYLLDLGHRNIGYLVHGLNEKGNHPQRLAGYRDTMAAAEIDVRPEWIQPVNELEKELGLPYWQSVQPSIMRLFERAPELTALMVVDDDLAMRAMNAILSSGRRIPQDISVIGFDNHSDSQFWYPSLTTVNHRLEDAGCMAAQAVEYAIEHPGNWNLPHLMLPTSLIIRKSVCKCERNQA